MRKVYAPGGSLAPTRNEYLRIVALRILRGQELDPTLPADEIAEAHALALKAGLKAPRKPRPPKAETAPCEQAEGGI